jgi:hypothetical protein
MLLCVLECDFAIVFVLHGVGVFSRVGELTIIFAIVKRGAKWKEMPYFWMTAFDIQRLDNCNMGSITTCDYQVTSKPRVGTDFLPPKLTFTPSQRFSEENVPSGRTTL